MLARGKTHALSPMLQSTDTLSHAHIQAAVCSLPPPLSTPGNARVRSINKAARSLRPSVAWIASAGAVHFDSALLTLGSGDPLRKTCRLAEASLQSAPGSSGPDDSVTQRPRRGRPPKASLSAQASPKSMELIPTKRRGKNKGSVSAASATAEAASDTDLKILKRFQCRRATPCSMRIKTHNLCCGCINTILAQQQQQQQQDDCTADGGGVAALAPFAVDDWSHEEPVAGNFSSLSSVGGPSTIRIAGVTLANRDSVVLPSSGPCPEPKTYNGLLGVYMSVRQEIQGWSDFFKESHGRRPRMSDVEETRVPWLIEKFSEYLRVRDMVEKGARRSIRKAALYAGARGRFASSPPGGPLNASPVSEAQPSGARWDSRIKAGQASQARGKAAQRRTSAGMDEVDSWMFSLFEKGEAVAAAAQSAQERGHSAGLRAGRQTAAGDTKQAGPKGVRQSSPRGEEIDLEGSCPLLDSVQARAAIAAAEGPCAKQWEMLGFGTKKENVPVLGNLPSATWPPLGEAEEEIEQWTLPPHLFKKAGLDGGPAEGHHRRGSLARDIHRHLSPGPDQAAGLLGTTDVLGGDKERARGGNRVHLRGLPYVEGKLSSEEVIKAAMLESWPKDGVPPPAWHTEAPVERRGLVPSQGDCRPEETELPE